MTAIPIHFIASSPGARARAALEPWLERASRMISPPGEARGAEHVVERTDERLLEEHLRGDPDAFRELVRRYKDDLLHFLTRFLGSRAAADDVFQETFLQLHLSADSFDSARRLKPWLFTIAANKARDHHRRQGQGRRAPLSLSAPVGQRDGPAYVDLMEADIPDPSDPVAEAERSHLVKRTVDSMPVHLREIILLGYFQRMSYQQIADALHIPLGTVKSRLHAAVAAFARAWEAAATVERPKGEERR